MNDDWFADAVSEAFLETKPRYRSVKEQAEINRKNAATIARSKLGKAPAYNPGKPVKVEVEPPLSGEVRAVAAKFAEASKIPGGLIEKSPSPNPSWAPRPGSLGPVAPRKVRRVDQVNVSIDNTGTIGPEAGVQAILDHIRGSDDPFKEGGRWLAKVSNAITSLQREIDDSE